MCFVTVATSEHRAEDARDTTLAPSHRSVNAKTIPDELAGPYPTRVSGMIVL